MKRGMIIHIDTNAVSNTAVVTVFFFFFVDRKMYLCVYYIYEKLIYLNVIPMPLTGTRCENAYVV